jgi:hypothetical protein
MRLASLSAKRDRSASMIRRYLSRLTLVSVVVSLVLTGAPTVRAGDSDIGAALQFRELFGLSTSKELVYRLAADPGAVYPDQPIPLTVEEKADLDRRQYVQEHKQELLKFGLAHPSLWGGLWTDQRRGGILVIELTDVADAWRQKLEDLAPTGASLELQSVARSIAELKTIQAAIENDWREVESLGISVYAVGISVPTNQVRASVSAVTPSAQSWFDTRYGPGVVSLEAVEEPGFTSCSSRTNCPGPPLRGGISGSFGCSIAFVANKGGATHYMYTAGHCANNGSSWYHSSKYLGTMRDDSTYSNSTADAALIGPIASADISRWVYNTSSSVAVVTSIQQYWEDSVGDRVCLSAKMASAIRCGTIVDTSLDIEIQPGVVLREQRRANYAWQFGDSGGAVLNGSKAMGIQSGYVGSNATYSQIGHVQGRTSSFVNTTNCGNYC